jgi:ketosteroid isomerase-like protein
MNKYFGLVSGILLLGSVMIGCNDQCKKNKTATAEELSQMNRDFAAALNNKDAVAAANCYTEDATVHPPNEAPVSGRANIQKYWEGAIAAGAFDVAVATISTGSSGDLGYEIGRFQMSMKDSTGKVSTERGKYIELLRRGEDGKWRSTHGIWNTDTLALK